MTNDNELHAVNLDLEAERLLARRKSKRTAEKRTGRECRKKFMTLFIHGKQVRVPRPPMIEGMPVDEFLTRNADLIWLHQTEKWELLTSCKETSDSTDAPSPLHARLRIELQIDEDL